MLGLFLQQISQIEDPIARNFLQPTHSLLKPHLFFHYLRQLLRKR